MIRTVIRNTIPLILICAAQTLQQGCAPETVAQAQGAERRIPVTTTRIQERDFEERVAVQGNVLARHYAMIAPTINGQATDVFVEEGDRVTANETALLQIDKVALTQAYEIALQDRVVAEHAQRDAEAQKAAAQAQYEKARLDYERFKRLRDQEAITPDAMEQMEAGYTVAKAQRERAETAVQLRKEQAKQADAALAIAQKHLDDSLIISPIDGWVTFRGIKPGEYAAAGTPVFRISDTSTLEVSAFLSGEYYPKIKTGETHVRVQVSGIDMGRIPIFYKSPEIQDQLRTFEIKALIDTPPEGVVPGAIAQIETTLQTRTGLGVPHDVVQIRDGKTVVFVVEEDAARAVEVVAGLTADGWTEMVGDTLDANALVIRRGYNLVNDGAPVDVQGEEE